MNNDEENRVPLVQPKLITCKTNWKELPFLGYILIVIYVGLSNLVNLLVKDLTDRISPLPLILLRSLIMMCVSLPWSLVTRQPAFSSDLTLKETVLLIFRGVVGFLHILASFYSLNYLDIGDQKMVVSIRPAFVMVFARVFLKEALGMCEGILTVFMLIGIIIVLKPPFLYGSIINHPYDNESLISALIVFFTAAISSFSTIILRKLRKQHVVSLILSNQLLFVTQSFLVCFLGGYEIIALCFTDRLMVLLMSLTVFLYSSINIMALKILEANIVAVVTNCLDLLTALLLQMAYYKKLPDIWASFGALFVIISLFIFGGKKLELCPKLRIKLNPFNE